MAWSQEARYAPDALTIIRLVWKSFSGTNALVYLASSATMEKSVLPDLGSTGTTT
jgi:hypothetical protein